MKQIASVLLLALFIGGCVPVPPTPPPTATATRIITPSQIPSPTQTALSTTTNFSAIQIRTPGETDGREVLTAFWSESEMVIYYALVNEISDTPLWFEISLERGQNFENMQLSSPPKLMYTPYLPAGGLYLDYRGLVSPSGRYRFQITHTGNFSLYLLDDMEQSKVKLLETSDMNFRGAYWMPGENKVAFGIGPEFGTEIYFYNIGEGKLISSTDLVGYADWSLSEWALSPDGTYIAILDGGQSLHLFSLDRSFFTTIPSYQNNVRWAGNSKRIYFYYGDQLYNPTNIGYFDIPTQSTQELIPLSTLEKFGIQGFFDVSPDGNQLVFWQAGNIWLLSFQ